MMATRPNAMRGRLDVVDRLQDRLSGEADEIAELRRQHGSRRLVHLGNDGAGNQRRRDRDRMGDASLVGEQPLELHVRLGRAVPHEIVAPVPGPQVIVRPCHRIAEHLLARRQAERHVHEQFGVHRRRNRILRDEGSPGRIARIERRDLGEEMRAHGGAQSVGADRGDRLAPCCRRQTGPSRELPLSSIPTSSLP